MQERGASGRDRCPQRSVRRMRYVTPAAQRRARDSPPYLDAARAARGAAPPFDIGNSANRLTPSRIIGRFVHFIYLDESGDPGLKNSPTKHYILAGLSVHHDDWHEIDKRLRAFRKWAEEVHGLNLAHEIHAAEFLGAANMHCGLRREQRLIIVRRLIGILSQSPPPSITTLRLASSATRSPSLHEHHVNFSSRTLSPTY